MNKAERKAEKARLFLAVAIARTRLDQARQRKHAVHCERARAYFAPKPKGYRPRHVRRAAREKRADLIARWRITVADERAAALALKEALAAARAFRLRCEEEDNTY